MPKLLLITLLLAASPLLTLMAGNLERDAEPSLLEVRYTRIQVTDTTQRDSLFHKDEMMLRVGKSKSLFCSVKCLFKDSISAVDRDAWWKIMQTEMDKGNPHLFSTIGGNVNVYLYKNYPEGKVTEISYFDMEDWIYSEPWEKPQWEIGNETKEILGYQCIKATADYRGRRWRAWFAPDIPIQEGPWKLCGLPGLILEASDANSDYLFTADGLIQKGTGNVAFMNYRSHSILNEVTRDKYFNNWWRYKNSNFAAKMKAAFSNLDIKATRKQAPVRYDKEETDYPHEL